MSNAQIRALAQQIYALTDDAQIHAWAQSIYDASPDPVVAPPPAEIARITLYEHDNYAGKSFSSGETVPNFASVGFNDLASSAEVAGRWEVCSDSNFRGMCITLAPGKYPSLRALGMNDSISSCRPVVPAAKERKEYFYFTSALGDAAEVKDHVTAIWSHCWGEDPDSTRQMVETKLPTVGEFTHCVFNGTSYRSDAEARLLTMFDGYKKAGVLTQLKKLYIDEPAVAYATMKQGVDAVRRIMAEYSELSTTCLMVCFGDYGRGAEDYYCIDLFDDIAVDAYGERAGIADPGGRLDRLAAKLRPGQRFYAVPATNTEVGLLSPGELDKVVQFVLEHPLGGGIMPYTWFDRTDVGGGLGARSNALRQPCIDAGMKIKEYNNGINSPNP